VHIVCLDIHRFRVGFSLRDGYKRLKIDFLAIEFKKATFKLELPAINLTQHLADLLTLSKRLLDVDTMYFLEVDVDNHPVGVFPGLKIIRIDALEPQEFENLVFVDVLGHVSHNVLLQ